MAITTDQTRIIRTLIPDTDDVFGEAENEFLFTDQQIADFFTAGSNSVIRAAGLANYAIATSEALISKKIRTQDLQTDGAAVANALINKANALFIRADKEDAKAETAGYFDIINYGEGWGIERPELTEASYLFDENGNRIVTITSVGVVGLSQVG